MADHADLEAWLRDDDEASRSARAERLRVIVEEYGPETYRAFPGGPVSAWAFEEARRAYVHGLDLSCVVMTQVCLEHLLHGLFKMTGRDDLDRATFETLLLEAHAERFLNDAEYELFERLRKLRNPYVHPRPISDEAGLVRRAVSSDTPVDDIVITDAQEAVTALLRLTSRPPFAVLASD